MIVKRCEVFLTFVAVVVVVVTGRSVKLTIKISQSIADS